MIKIKIPPDALLFSVDVESMYNNTDNITVFKELKQSEKPFFLNPDFDHPDTYKSTQHSLEHNDFLFGSQCFLQIHGKAKGKQFAASYVNLFMAEWEK